MVSLIGCNTVDHVGLGIGATAQGDLSGTVQIYFRDADGQLLTARLPRATVARTIAVPVSSDLDLPTGQTLPRIP